MSARVKLTDLLAHRERIGERVDEAIERVVRSGRWIMGPEVHELEAELAATTGVRHAIACSNGTDALKLGLLALRMSPGDAVLCPSFTFTATAEVIALLGGVPVFVDCAPGSFNLSVESAAAAAAAARRSGLRVVGTIAVDLFGVPASHDDLRTLCEDEQLWLLCDSAQAFGAQTGGRHVVGFGAAATTSFFPAKPLGCYGDGGAVFTDDDDLAAVVRSLVVHGKGTGKYDNVRVGMNARLDTIQAAVLLEKLRIFDDELAARRAVAETYADRLGAVVVTPRVAGADAPTWAQYTIRVPQRDEFKRRLDERGIETAVYYPRPLHLQPAYSNGEGTSFVGLDLAEQLAAEVLSLPMHPYVAPHELDTVTAAVAEVATELGSLEA